MGRFHTNFTFKADFYSDIKIVKGGNILDYSQCTCKSEYLLINEFKHTLTYTKYTYEYDKFELYRSEI